MPVFNILSTDFRENQKLTDSYTTYEEANRVFNDELSCWKSLTKRGQHTIIELTPTQFALYNQNGELIYTCQIIAEPDNKFE